MSQKSIRTESKTGSNLSRKELEEYRSSWTHDNIESKKIRFLTESKRMTQLADKFKEFSVRMPPGCPEPLKRLRDQLLAKQGNVAFGKLKLALGTGVIHVDDFNNVLTKLDVIFSRLEFAKVISTSRSSFLFT